MFLDAKKLSKAAAMTAGIAYALCAISVAVAPEIAFKLFGSMFHLVSTEDYIANTVITAGGFMVGIVQVAIYAGIFGWLFGYIYNGGKKCCENC